MQSRTSSPPASPPPPPHPASPTRSRSGSSGSGRSSEDYDSSAALILVPDSGDPSDRPFDIDLSSEDEDDEDAQHARLLASPVPPLSSPTVFLYLVAPFLKLGAMLVADVQTRKEVVLIAVVGFAGLSAFARQIWYMLARYIRCADLEEIVLESFAGGRGHEKRRRWLRYVVRGSVGLLRILLAAVYLRASTDVLLPLLPAKLLLPTNFMVTFALALIMAVFFFSPSLATGRVIYATWLSIVAFIAWLSTMAYAHAKGMLTFQASSTSLGTLWDGLPIVAFAFTTGSTIPLYAALKGAVQPGLPKQKRSKSFKLLSLISIALSALLILPLIFFRSPETPQQSPTFTVRAMTAIFSATALSLAIPSILITSPALPVSFAVRRLTSFPLSKTLVIVATVLLSLCPQPIFGILSDVLLVLAFLSTYMLPAFIHITLHHFRRPLSIIIPPSTPATPRATASESDSRYDELLQRKERTLQRRRLGRRIVWDVGVWTLLVPVGGGGLVWAVGRIAGKW
ncbi:hypothetical protein CERSUDRAFT_112364 [Gelatoporia subvermispora B]|uniref:Amino acid transporter transmembrane domain-containing protein n=1 Tax=Ceriporiopsis subvermispora (strain B) TaxID=914234 RepID=M2R6C1_CERS8|nr:hypothetical protein CERSUDRAFT_112364 [Gelatoporia subvermispora B]